MHLSHRYRWQHPHDFGQGRERPGERRTLTVVTLTAVMMVLEVAAGLAFGSMALLADGLHMASHAAALAISVWAYRYARRHATDERFSFGTGKVNALAGFTGALLLAGFSAVMAWESLARFAHPVTIAFTQAMLVAVGGLIVNGVSVAILSSSGHHEHDTEPHDAHDHNLRAAYFHVLADALTSILAIGALLAGKLYRLVWLDPMMGIVGAILVLRWAASLVRTTSAELLDHQASVSLRRALIEAIEVDGDAAVVDLHLWAIGGGQHAAIVAILARDPRSVEEYRARVPASCAVAHLSVEVRRCTDCVADFNGPSITSRNPD